MNVNNKKPIILGDILSAIKSCYPNATFVIDQYLIFLDINDKVKYTVYVKKGNFIEVIPQKAVWNRTFEMKAKAQEISFRISEFLEKGSSSIISSGEILAACPRCKNPNTKLVRECEWCGNQII